MDSIKILFIDQISFGTLLRASFLGRSLETIWHFDPLTPVAQRLLTVFRVLGLVRAKVRQVEHHLGQIKGESGPSPWLTVNKRIPVAIAADIRKAKVEPNPLVRFMSTEWPSDKLHYYFYSQIEEQIRRECARISLTIWIVETQSPYSLAQSALLIQRGDWFSYLESHAQSQGIWLIAYRRWLDPTRFAKPLFRLLRTVRKRMPGILAVVKSLLRRSPVLSAPINQGDRGTSSNHASTSTVGIKYSFQPVSFDPTHRSDLFWLNDSGIPFSDVLIYDYDAQSPLDPETSALLDEKGVRLLGWAPGVQHWSPTPQIFSIFLRLSLKLATGVLKNLAQGRWVSFYFIRLFLALSRDYSYWLDFYSTNRVRVNVGINSSIYPSQVLALNALGGITVSYQYTANIDDNPTPLISNGEDVQCLFSSSFELPFRTVGAPIDRYVHIGFVHDSAPPAIRNGGCAEKHREELRSNGAEFIICFFDETSLDTWYSAWSHQDGCGEYAFLLNWLIDDPTLGLVFKPKRWGTLFQRMSGISGLIEQAQLTRRCKFLVSETLTSSIYPAEAALAADVCLSKLGGLTAGLEARLAGVPSALVATHHVSDHAFYEWGRGRVVFDDWGSARTAIDRWRANPAAYPEFGDWSPALNDLDPFQDGQATVRMGSYIRWVFDSLKEGKSREAALDAAGQNYGQKWGENRVTVGRREIG